MKTLSDLDQELLAEVTEDPFRSNALVAKKLNLSVSLVTNRLRALHRNKVTQVLAVLDLHRMQQSFCFLHLRIRGRGVGEVATDIAQRRLVMMISELADGDFDLLALVRFPDVRSLMDVLFQDIGKIPGVESWRVGVVVDVPVFRSEYVTYTDHYESPAIDENVAMLRQDLPAELCDDTDLEIIAHLQQNARQSINTIARKVGLKASTARYRINNLKNNKIIHFVRVIDPQALGISTYALVEIQLEIGLMDGVVEALRGKSWLPQLFVCAGSVPLVGIMVTQTRGDVLRFKRELLTMRGVREVTLSYLHRAHRVDYRWAQEPS